MPRFQPEEFSSRTRSELTRIELYSPPVTATITAVAGLKCCVSMFLMGTGGRNGMFMVDRGLHTGAVVLAALS